MVRGNSLHPGRDHSQFTAHVNRSIFEEKLSIGFLATSTFWTKREFWMYAQGGMCTRCDSAQRGKGDTRVDLPDT